jgi:hypothetical protein
MNNCHSWDPIIQEHFPYVQSKLPSVDEDFYINDLLGFLSNSKYMSCTERMVLSNPTDRNINYRPRLLLAQTWSLIRLNKDFVEAFTDQLDDMIETSGYCEQGWSNRIVQVLFGCDLI